MILKLHAMETEVMDIDFLISIRVAERQVGGWYKSSFGDPIDRKGNPVLESKKRKKAPGTEARDKKVVIRGSDHHKSDEVKFILEGMNRLVDQVRGMVKMMNWMVNEIVELKEKSKDNGKAVVDQGVEKKNDMKVMMERLSELENQVKAWSKMIDWSIDEIVELKEKVGKQSGGKEEEPIEEEEPMEDEEESDGE